MGDRNVTGLWVADMPWQLLWRTSTYTRYGARVSGIPSWSWLHKQLPDGRYHITYGQPRPRVKGGIHTSFSSLPNVTLQLPPGGHGQKNAIPFYDLGSSRTVLAFNGPVLPAATKEAYIRSVGDPYQVIEDFWKMSLDRGSNELDTGPALCLVLGREGLVYQCLVVRKCSDEDSGLYTRIGVLDISISANQDVLSLMPLLPRMDTQGICEAFAALPTALEVREVAVV